MHGLSARWCPMSLTSSLGEFLGYWAGFGILGYRPCWCPSPFPSPSISRCFSIYSSIGFHSCFFFTTDVLAPIPSTNSVLRRVSRLGTGSGTQCCGSRGGIEVRKEQKSQYKFLLWPCRVEPRTLVSRGHEHYQ